MTPTTGHHGSHLHRFVEVHAEVGSELTRSEVRTWLVVGIAAVTMVAELIVGQLSGSMALFADGVHMATHVGALGLAAAAYWVARRYAGHSAFTFGTGKVSALSAYTSALMLAAAAIWMAKEALERLAHPISIAFDEALIVATIGLAVNLASAWLLGHTHDHGPGHAHGHHDHGHDHAHDHHDDAHDHGPGHAHDHHDHGHDEAHDHDHAHDDHAPAHLTEAHAHGAGAPNGAPQDALAPKEAMDPNARAAYLHVLADALTSVTAIAALFAGRTFDIVWLDPVIALLGAVVVFRWGLGLLRDTTRQLLDVAPSAVAAKQLKTSLESIDDVEVADLHLWEIAPGQRGCIVKIVTATPRDTAYYRAHILEAIGRAHLTVEVQRCHEAHGC